MSIERDFIANYPHLVYIEHRYLDGPQIGVSYVYLYDRGVHGGVKIFNIENGKINWESAVRTFPTWTDVYKEQKTR